MPADTSSAGSPQDWLRHARSDLALASAHKTRRLLYEHLCFHAQQAAEKAVKAVLVRHGISISKTHDLAYLLGQLPPHIKVPISLVTLPTLTKYAVQLRYPGEAVPATARDRRNALQMAQAAIDWAVSQLSTKRQ